MTSWACHPAPAPSDQGWGHEFTRGTDGVRLHYTRTGTGPTVLLLHGWPGFWYDWRHVIPRLRPRCDVIAPDFRGFGDSSVPPGDPTVQYDETKLAADVLALLDRLGVERCVVAGYDIGSAVGPAVARLAPARVSALALFNPSHPYVGDRRNTAAMQAELWHHGFHAQPWSGNLLGRDRASVATYLAHFFSHWTGRVESLVGEEINAVIEAFSRPGALDASFGWYRSRQAARLRRDRYSPPEPVTCPVFVAWGDSDPVSPISWRDGLEITYPAVDVAVLDGVGHFVPVEAPDAAAECIGRAVAAARQAR